MSGENYTYSNRDRCQAGLWPPTKCGQRSAGACLCRDAVVVEATDGAVLAAAPPYPKRRMPPK